MAKSRNCDWCDLPITEDVMVPENAGPMHPDCFTEWVTDD